MTGEKQTKPKVPALQTVDSGKRVALVAPSTEEHPLAIFHQNLNPKFKPVPEVSPHLGHLPQGRRIVIKDPNGKVVDLSKARTSATPGPSQQQQPKAQPNIASNPDGPSRAALKTTPQAGNPKNSSWEGPSPTGWGPQATKVDQPVGAGNQNSGACPHNLKGDQAVVHQANAPANPWAAKTKPWQAQKKPWATERKHWASEKRWHGPRPSWKSRGPQEHQPPPVPADYMEHELPVRRLDWSGSQRSSLALSDFDFSDGPEQTKEFSQKMSQDIRNEIGVEVPMYRYNNELGNPTIRFGHFFDGQNYDLGLQTEDYNKNLVESWIRNVTADAKASLNSKRDHFNCDINPETGCFLAPVAYPETRMSEAEDPELRWRQKNWSSELLRKRKLATKRGGKYYRGEVPPSSRQPPNVQISVNIADLFVPQIPMHLRPATASDMEAVASLYNSEDVQKFDSVPLGPANFEKILTDTHGHELPFIVAVSGSARVDTLKDGIRFESNQPQQKVLPSNLQEGLVLGFAYLSVWKPGLAGSKTGTSRATAEAHVYVHTSWRRKKIGSALLDRLLASVSLNAKSKKMCDFWDPSRNPAYAAPCQHDRYTFKIYMQYLVKTRFDINNGFNNMESQENQIDDIAWLNDLLETKFGFKKKVRFEAAYRSPKVEGQKPICSGLCEEVNWTDNGVIEYQMANGNTDSTTTAEGTLGVGSEVQQSAQTSPVAGSSDQDLEPLACMTCRSRKLKCDRIKPICTRCGTAGGESQVEGLIRNVTKQSLGPDNQGASDDASATAALDKMSATTSLDELSEEIVSGSERANYSFGFACHGSASKNVSDMEAAPAPDRATSSKRPHSPQPFDAPRVGGTGIGGFSDDLVELGRFEGLPPIEMIEDLHRLFFHFRKPKIVPIVHPGNYMRAFYSPTHMRPPMCLQYAIWANAAKGHPMYDRYYDVFYHRTRQYLEADELKARSMLFTRAAMTAARCARLVHMLGLHRLDDPSEDAEDSDVPALPPPKSWVDLEERRRTFWGAYCANVHITMNTKWPIMIDVKDTTTRLPASEDAFNTGSYEASPTLQEAFGGSSYSSFASMAVIGYLFNELLNHVHRSKVSDRPDDLQDGPYWKRHREIDNNLDDAFMFLPDKFRLPTNITETVALQVNLSIHASVLCLHSAACDAVKKHGLDKRLGERSRVRRLNAAREIVNIMRLARETMSPYKTPLVALSMYCASTVYIDLARETFTSPSPVPLPPWVAPELEFIVNCMESIGRQYIITRAYLNQLLLDVEQNDVSAFFNLPNIKRYGCCNHGIPLLGRTAASKYTKNGGRPVVTRMMSTGGGGRIIPEEASWSDDGGGCGIAMTAAQACGSNLNENGGAAAGVVPPPEYELGACSGGTQCPGRQGQNGDTTGTGGGSSGPGLPPEAKRRRIHQEQQPFLERIDLSDLFKFGSSALPSQYRHRQPTAAVPPDFTTESSDEFNDGWGPGPATAVGPPYLMKSNSDTSPPVIQLPHRSVNDSSTAMFADNSTGTEPSCIPVFDPNQHIPLEDMTNMDLFSNITETGGVGGMRGIGQIDLGLTDVVVNPLFLSNSNSSSNSNDCNYNDLGNNINTCTGQCPLLDGISGNANGDNNNGTVTVGGHGGDDDGDAWMLLTDDVGNSGTGTTTGEESPTTGTGSWDNML
ncbi:hypothetical protein QR685DRAFT_569427 [Neurospora intermedia]|uniref:Zn(2)-C6 fungal-type domain-containing protein n=1 Tax=Neurospora intermedia TaxID=5142 RepID=A0ABR3DN61_NEUIN